MTNQVTTRTCPDCRTIFRHRGQDRCPRCGHRFGTVQTAPSAESQPIPQRSTVVERPAPPPPAPEPPPPPPPPPPAPTRPEPVHESTSELDALLLPYTDNATHRSEAPAPETPVESTIPPVELPPEPEPVRHEPPPVTIPGSAPHAPPTDPLDKALSGKRLVPADARRSKARRSRMPWYLRRETLIVLTLAALVLIAVIFQFSS